MTALLALSALGAQAQDAQAIELSPKYSALMLELQDPNPDRRYEAASELLKIQPLPAEVGSELLHRAAVDGSALKAIGEAGSQFLPIVMEGLKNPRDQLVRTGSVSALGLMARNNPALWPAFVDLLHNEDSIIRQQASPMLTNLSERDQKIVVPLLRTALKDKDVRTRLAASDAVYGVGGMNKDALPELSPLLLDSDPRVRSGVAHVLWLIGSPAASAVPNLLVALKDPVPMVRMSAALALVRVDPHHRGVAPVLIAFLDPKEPYQRRSIVDAISQLGTDGQDGAPALADLLTGDPDREVRKGAVEALEKVDPKNAAKPLSQALLHDKDLEVRKAALNSIGKLGDDGAAAIPALIESLRSEDDDIRKGATDDLQSLGKLAIPPLLAALQNPSVMIREGAIEALPHNPPLPEEVAKALTVAASKDKSRTVRNAAAVVLQGASLPAGDAVLGKLEQDYAASPKPIANIDKNRQYSKEEIIASLPPDKEHAYPLRLTSLFPLEDSNFAVTLHQGQERPDRLVIWKKVGVNRYQVAQTMENDPDADETFRPPTLFTPKGEPNGQKLKFLDIVNVGRRFADETLYAIDTDANELRPVDIESAETWYRSKLHPGEETWRGEGNLFVDDQQPGFEFYIAKSKDPSCCPSGGQVTGTYKIIEDVQQSDDPTKPPSITWKFVPDTAVRKPIPPP